MKRCLMLSLIVAIMATAACQFPAEPAMCPRADTLNLRPDSTTVTVADSSLVTLSGDCTTEVVVILPL